MTMCYYAMILHNPAKKKLAHVTVPLQVSDYSQLSDYTIR